MRIVDYMWSTNAYIINIWYCKALVVCYYMNRSKVVCFCFVVISHVTTNFMYIHII